MYFSSSHRPSADGQPHHLQHHHQNRLQESRVEPPSGPPVPLEPQQPYPSSSSPSSWTAYRLPTTAAMSRPGLTSTDDYRPTAAEPSARPPQQQPQPQQLPSLRSLLQPPPPPPSSQHVSHHRPLELSDRSASATSYASIASHSQKQHQQPPPPALGSDYRPSDHSSGPSLPPLSLTDQERRTYPMDSGRPVTTLGSEYSAPSSGPSSGRFEHSHPIPRRGSSMSPANFRDSPETVNASLHRVGLNGEAVEISRTQPRRRTDSSQRAPPRVARCVGQQVIEGEGLCYIYEDGSYCRTVIDGEPVNPSWGITKAGKPRKRLAQACLTCREKKIKCEPGIPKCVQCSKSQRVCRGGLSQPGSSQDEPSPPRTSSPLKRASSEMLRSAYDPKGWDSAGATAPGQLPKVQRMSSESINSPRSPINQPHQLSGFRSETASNGGPEFSAPSYDTDCSSSNNAKSNLSEHPSPSFGPPIELGLGLSWEIDPCEAEPALSSYFLDLYFAHVNSATYGMFPEADLRRWAMTCDRKSQDDRMVLYTILAMGSIFSPDTQRLKIGRHFASIAAHAVHKRFGKFTLQLCHSRLLLGLYYFAAGKTDEAWDYCGSALRAISGLKLHTEEGVKEIQDDELDYNLDRHTLEECRRRTFWSGFLMDVGRTVNSYHHPFVNDETQRYNGLSGGTLCVIRLEDTWVRLPCEEEYFGGRSRADAASATATATTPTAPIFTLDLLDGAAAGPRQPFGRMANLALISALWGDVISVSNRLIHHSPDSATYIRRYEEFYAHACARLDNWLDQLPSHLRCTPPALDAAFHGGYAGTFISMHALYHSAIMRLNRRVRVSDLPPAILRRNISRAVSSAKQLLVIAHHLCNPERTRRLERRHSGMDSDPPTPAFLFTTPFPGLAFLLAIDVLSAGGAIAFIPRITDAFSAGQSCLEELAPFWASARAQNRSAGLRVKQLANIALGDPSAPSYAGRPTVTSTSWRLDSPLELGATKENDAVYGASSDVFHTAISHAEAEPLMN